MTCFVMYSKQPFGDDQIAVPSSKWPISQWSWEMRFPETSVQNVNDICSWRDSTYGRHQSAETGATSSSDRNTCSQSRRADSVRFFAADIPNGMSFLSTSTP